MRFRELEERDNAVIASIIRDNLKRYGLDIPGTAYYDEALDHLTEVYGREDAKYYVVVDEKDRVLGGIGFSRFYDSEDTAELQKLYLCSEAKGSGSGYKMISFIEDKMRQAGFRRSYLETHDVLREAVHIYIKSGYTEIEQPEVIGHGSMNMFFIKELY
ncbi:MAG: GNAT family N-acetyltransferase [Lachnospiraceae bacterium]|nr:GNAT family N-acetyltransferase [Lachnospiraceae bacterium]